MRPPPRCLLSQVRRLQLAAVRHRRPTASTEITHLPPPPIPPTGRAVKWDTTVPRPAHIAIPVHDLDAARQFYGTLLGCEEGRSASTWIDWNLFGNQIVRRRKPGEGEGRDDVSPRHDSINLPPPFPHPSFHPQVTHFASKEYRGPSHYNGVDKDMVRAIEATAASRAHSVATVLGSAQVPVPHMGVAMTVPEFHLLAARMAAAKVRAATRWGMQQPNAPIDRPAGRSGNGVVISDAVTGCKAARQVLR